MTIESDLNRQWPNMRIRDLTPLTPLPLRIPSLLRTFDKEMKPNKMLHPTGEHERSAIN